MNFERMREFVAITTYRSYQKAAEELYVSEATLSRHIREMEAELGGAVFSRTTRKVELTSLGAILLPYARKIVGVEQEYLSAISEHLDELSKTVNIGCGDTYIDDGVADIFADFVRFRPDAQINVCNSGESTDTYKHLKAGKYNLAVIRETLPYPERTEIERLPLKKNTLMVLVAKEHALANEVSLNINDLSNESFLLPEEKSSVYSIVSELFDTVQYSPIYSFRGIPRDIMIRSLSKNYGIAILPVDTQNIPAEFEENGIKLVPLKPHRNVYLNLVFIRDNLNKMEREFLQYFNHNYVHEQKL